MTFRRERMPSIAARSKAMALYLYALCMVVSSVSGFLETAPYTAPSAISSPIQHHCGCGFHHELTNARAGSNRSPYRYRDEITAFGLVKPFSSTRASSSSSRRKQLEARSNPMGDFDYTSDTTSISNDRGDDSQTASTSSTASSAPTPTTTMTSDRRRRGPIRRRSSAAAQEKEQQRDVAKKKNAEALKDPTLLSSIPFQNRDDIHPSTRRAISELLGLKRMTTIQARTYPAALAGNSVLGRARTGTGKTIAFLLPGIERLLEPDLDLYRPGRSIGMLVVAPTRELAIQIADQAGSLLTYHNGMSVACIYGGTKMQRDMRIFTNKSGLPTILVATPGRLLDHLQTTRIQGRKFSDVVSETKITVFDETDILFGNFRNEIRNILTYLPRSDKRQTMLFSATMPNKLRISLRDSFKISFEEVDCVDATSKKEETNIRVKQSYVVMDSMENYLTYLIAVILYCQPDTSTNDANDTNNTNNDVSSNSTSSSENSKLIIFFPTNKLARLFHGIFQEVQLGTPLFQLHSSMSQASRNRSSEQFRNANQGILLTSDVSARGVDYPGVSHVIQFGAPRTKNGYVHRLGRTGRAGQEGKGLVVLMPFEGGFASALKKRQARVDRNFQDWVSANDGSTTISSDNDAQTEEQDVDGTAKQNIRAPRSASASLQSWVGICQQTVARANPRLVAHLEASYLSFIAYYVGLGNDLVPNKVVESANDMLRSCGAERTPEIDQDLAKRLRL